ICARTAAARLSARAASACASAWRGTSTAAQANTRTARSRTVTTGVRRRWSLFDGKTLHIAVLHRGSTGAAILLTNFDASKGNGRGCSTVPDESKPGQNKIDVKMVPALHLRNE